MPSHGAPHHLRTTECVWPTCSTSPSDFIETPLCDRHLIAVYRSVRDLMAAVGPELAATFHTDRG